MDGPVKEDMMQNKILPDWASDRERELVRNYPKRQPYPGNDGKMRKARAQQLIIMVIENEHRLIEHCSTNDFITLFITTNTRFDRRLRGSDRMAICSLSNGSDGQSSTFMRNG